MILTEKKLKFDFNDKNWSYLIKYDESTDFKKIEKVLEKTKAVDFIGILDSSALVFIEAKDYRGNRIKNKPKFIDGEKSLKLNVAWKFRDTLAGIIGGFRNSTNMQSVWNAYLNLLSKPNKKLHLILWLEQDVPNDSQQQKKKNLQDDILRRKLKESMSWLTTKVEIVVDREKHPFTNSLKVSDLTN